MVRRFSTQIGPLSRLFSSLAQTSTRIFSETLQGSPPALKSAASATARSDAAVVRLAEDQLAGGADHLRHARLRLGAGGIDHAADGARRADRVPDDVARIGLRHPAAVLGAAMAGVVPPGDAVGDEDHRRIRPQQRPDGAGDAAQRRHLGADHHRILRGRARPGRRPGAGRTCMSPSGGADDQPLRLHGGEVGAARDDGQIGPALGQAAGEVAADRAGAEDADLHAGVPLCWRKRGRGESILPGPLIYF